MSMFPLILRRHGRGATDPFEAISREFDRALGRYFGEGELPSMLAPYAVDVREDDSCYYVDAELPGFTKDDVAITLENGVLTIHAERKMEEEQKGKKGEPIHVERRWSEFQRSFTLPSAVKEDSVRAELSNGLLTVTMDKREEVKPRRIQISAGEAKGKQPQIEEKKAAEPAKPQQQKP